MRHECWGHTTLHTITSAQCSSVRSFRPFSTLIEEHFVPFTVACLSVCSQVPGLHSRDCPAGDGLLQQPARLGPALARRAVEQTTDRHRTRCRPCALTAAATLRCHG